MNLTLTRIAVDAHGVFSECTDENGSRVFVTAEHAYLQDDGSYLPKIPDGEYQCVLGVHQLSSGPPFDTWEVTGVPEHVGILFHKGNLPQSDSMGCVLVGESFGDLNGVDAILNSSQAFQSLLILQGHNNFKLTVVTPHVEASN